MIIAVNDYYSSKMYNNLEMRDPLSINTDLLHDIFEFEETIFNFNKSYLYHEYVIENNDYSISDYISIYTTLRNYKHTEIYGIITSIIPDNGFTVRLSVFSKQDRLLIEEIYKDIFKVLMDAGYTDCLYILPLQTVITDPLYTVVSDNSPVVYRNTVRDDISIHAIEYVIRRLYQSEYGYSDYTTIQLL